MGMLKLNIHKSMGPEVMHPQAESKLADINAGPVLVISDRL